MNTHAGSNQLGPRASEMTSQAEVSPTLATAQALGFRFISGFDSRAGVIRWAWVRNDATLVRIAELPFSSAEEAAADALKSLPQDQRRVRLRLSLDVTYDLGDEHVDSVREQLESMAVTGIQRGLLTGDTCATVARHDLSITVVPAPARRVVMLQIPVMAEGPVSADDVARLVGKALDVGLADARETRDLDEADFAGTGKPSDLDDHSDAELADGLTVIEGPSVVYDTNDTAPPAEETTPSARQSNVPG